MTETNKLATTPQPLTENDLCDMANEFLSTKGLTFMFQAGTDGLTGANELGPNLLSAAELAIAHWRGVSCEGPLHVNAAEPAPNTQDVIELVRGKLELLSRCGNVSFFLLWNAHGNAEPRLDHSEDLCEEGVRQEIVSYLQDGFEWRCE